MAKKRRMRKAKHFADLETAAATEATAEPAPAATEATKTTTKEKASTGSTKEKASTGSTKWSRSRKTDRK